MLNPVLGDKTSALQGTAVRIYDHSGSLSFLVLPRMVGLILPHSCSSYLQSSASRYFAQGNEQKQQIWSHQCWEQAEAGHVFSGALAASFAGMLILNRIDLKIDQRLLNTSGKPKEEKSRWWRTELGVWGRYPVRVTGALPWAAGLLCLCRARGPGRDGDRDRDQDWDWDWDPCHCSWRCLGDGRGSELCLAALPRAPAWFEGWHVGKLFKSVFVFNFSPRRQAKQLQCRGTKCLLLWCQTVLSVFL